MHIRATRFSFAPLCHHSVEQAVSHRARSPVQFGSCRARAPVSLLLICDHPGALCTFGWPVFHFLPCAIVRSGTLCEGARSGRAISFEGARISFAIV